jgi:hypothetical protein
MMFSQFLTNALSNCGLGVRPGYYSGRGANASDLNSRQLEAIHTAIVKNAGKKAGGAFIRMVEDIPVLSATDFLLTLAALESNKFIWDKNLLSTQKGQHFESIAEAIGTVGEVLARSNRQDSTDFIRREFLVNHGRSVPMSIYGPYS